MSKPIARAYVEIRFKVKVYCDDKHYKAFCAAYERLINVVDKLEPKKK